MSLYVCIAMERNTDCPDGIVSLHPDAKFFGDAMEIDEWDMAVIWSPETPEVEEGVSMKDVGSATGRAPAVNNGPGGLINEGVKGWNKYVLER